MAATGRIVEHHPMLGRNAWREVHDERSLPYRRGPRSSGVRPPFLAVGGAGGDVTVYPGYYAIGGRQSQPTLTTETDLTVTTTGHGILRVAKSDIGWSMSYQAALPNPNSTSHWEWLIFSADWNATTGNAVITYNAASDKYAYASL